ncbi:MAG: MurT ligase domain-containing protein [Thermoleophilia bacterium]
MQNSKAAIAAKIALARTVTLISGRAGHGGTTLPGRVVRAVDPGISGRLASRLPRGCMLVSATNGKTTTSAMIARIMEEESISLARNREGANLAAGVATALLKKASLGGGPGAELGLFEVDEAVFPEVARQLDPKAVLLMNLFRDQLDRYGELEHLAEIWRASMARLSPLTTTVINADDPLVAGMARLRPEQSLCFGIEDASAGGLVSQHASDSKYCIVCGHPFDYEVFYMGHLGKYHCPNCGNRRPSPTVFAENVSLDGMRGSSFDLITPGSSRVRVDIRLPGLYNVYNALAAAAGCTAMGLSPAGIVRGLAAFSAAFGRAETLSIGGKSVCLLLAKNPAGFNEVVRTLLIEPGQKSLMVALNDRIADGRDISWIWDVDLENLAGGVRSAVCSGTRAEEMAMRLKYAGVESQRLNVKRGLRQAFQAALDQTNSDETLYVLPTYTAMLALRQVIHQHFRPEGEMGDLVWK